MRRTVRVEGAPRAVGPYSQAVVAGGWLWVSGQIPLDPATGELVAGGVEAQARRALANLVTILVGAGSGPDRVVKVTLYLTDLGAFDAVNRVYAEVFPSEPPARVTVEVSRLPRGAAVEVDAVALVG
jgi:2-iminobutanoate/2-iminopropanoate deaminase